MIKGVIMINNLVNVKIIINTIDEYILLQELCTNKNIATNRLYTNDHIENFGLKITLVSFGNKLDKTVQARCLIYDDKEHLSNILEYNNYKIITVEEFKHL